jgi:hypothetical protein
MTGKEFRSKPYQNVRWMLDQVEEFYATKVVPRGGPGKFEKTAEVIVKLRGWEPTVRLYAQHMQSVLEELNIIYIPKVLEPGPAILFPLLDVRDHYILARLNPMYAFVIGKGAAKYAFLGNPQDTVGPNWLGMTHATIRRILDCRAAVLVEGPFDLLACRLLAPEVPVLSTGTKTFNEMHITHLRMLGVKDLWIMFDHEEGKTDAVHGAGDSAAAFLARKWQGVVGDQMRFHHYHPPASDPANCLKRLDWATPLRERLTLMRGITWGAGPG